MNADKFIEHFDYLLSLCRQARRKRKEWRHIVETLQQLGHWKRAYNLKGLKRKARIKNLEGKTQVTTRNQVTPPLKKRWSPNDEYANAHDADMSSLYDE